jgi:hypothetical protein
MAAAPSTAAGNKSAYGHFNKMQEARGDPMFAQLPETTDEDTVTKLLNDFAVHLMENADLDPKTKLGYFGKLKVAFAAKYSTLAMWEKEEKWYKPLYEDLKTGSERLYLLSDEDRIDSKCHPFYLEVQDDYISEQLRKDILDANYKDGKMIYAQDGKSLCAHLLKSLVGTEKLHRGPAQKRVWYVLCADAVGRGGEIKFQRYDEWYFDQNFQNIDATWSELKTLARNPMLFGPAKYGKGSYLCDFYHALGTFYVVEEGLARHGVLEQRHKYVFPQLDVGQVAKLLTDLIREHTNPVVRDKYSSRSVRKGMTTALQYHVTDAELNIRGGWQSTSTSTSYKEANVGLTLPALNAINGWTDIRSKKWPPRLECFEASTQLKFEQFMAKLFVIHLPAFESCGHLRPLLRTCTASLLMYLEDYEEDYSVRNLLVQRMYSAAEQANAQEPGCATAIETVRYWGKIIKEDFITRNVDSPDPEFANYREIADFQHRFNQDMVNRVARAEAATKAANLKVDAVLANQQQILAHQQQIVATLAQIQSGLACPVSHTATARVSLSPNEPARSTISNTLPNKKRSPDDNGISDVQRLVKHTKGTDVASAGETKQFPVSQIVVDLYFPAGDPNHVSAGSNFHGKQSRLLTMTYPALKEQDKLKLVMSLIEFVITENQWQQLCAKPQSEPQSKETIRSIAFEIEKQCLQKMYQLEKEAGMSKAESFEKCRGTPFFVGLGSRVRKYLNEVKRDSLRDTLKKQTTSIATMFGKQAAK